MYFGYKSNVFFSYFTLRWSFTATKQKHSASCTIEAARSALRFRLNGSRLIICSTERSYIMFVRDDDRAIFENEARDAYSATLASLLESGMMVAQGKKLLQATCLLADINQLILGIVAIQSLHHRTVGAALHDIYLYHNTLSLCFTQLPLEPRELGYAIDGNERNDERGPLDICLKGRIGTIDLRLPQLETACAAKHDIHDAHVAQ